MCDDLTRIINIVREVKRAEKNLGRPLERGEYKTIIVTGKYECTADMMDLWFKPSEDSEGF